MSVKGASRGVLVQLQTLATTGNGDTIAPPASFVHHTFIIKGNDIPSAGAIQIEGAHAYDYSGTWAALAGSPVTVPDGETIVQLEGLFPFMRARISTNVTSGTVDVYYVGAP